jgi:hypothetical protein
MQLVIIIIARSAIWAYAPQQHHVAWVGLMLDYKYKYKL